MATKTPSVLIVDTNSAVGVAYARHFERRSWEVAVVSTLLDAERKAVRMRPTVLVVDVLSLAEAEADIKRLRTLPTMLKTKIVVLARGATPEHVASLLAAGVHELILTPHTTPAHVVQHIESKYLQNI